MRLKKLKQNCKKILSCTLAIALMASSFVGVSSPLTVNAKFPSNKTNKSATLTHSDHVFVSNLSYLGTNCIERITLTSGKDSVAAFCLAPGKPLNNNSTYKSSELKAGYAEKYYKAALAFYYKDGHNKGDDKFAYRATTQLLIWRIAKYKESTKKDFKASDLKTKSLKTTVALSLNAMKNKGTIEFAKGKSASDYYDAAVKTIFTEGESKTYNNDVSYVKWSDGQGQIVLSGKYAPVEDVYVNLKINKRGVDANGNTVKNANLAGVEYYVYSDVKCSTREKDKDGNKLSIKLNANGEGTSSYMKLEEGEVKTVYVKEHSSTSGVNINNSVAYLVIRADGFKDGSKNTVTVPTASTVDDVWSAKLKLIKKGDDDKIIPGAVFEVYEWNGSKYVSTGDKLTTGSDGTVTSKTYYYTKTNVGKFMAKEVSVPRPYMNQGWSQEFTISKKDQTFEYTVINRAPKATGDVTVTKIDKITRKPISIDTKFYLYKYVRDYEYTDVTGLTYYGTLEEKGNGIYSLGNLPEGEYWVSEINSSGGYKYLAYKDPAGTLKTENIDDGFKFTIKPENESNHFVFEKENELIPCKITVLKLDKDTKKTLGGFTFGLYEYNENSESKDKYDLVSLGETDDKGELTFDNLNITHKYKVREISAKEGYTIEDDNEKEIDMLRDTGADTTKIQLTDWTGAKTDDMIIEKYKAVANYNYNVKVTFENEKVKRPIHIHKTSSNRTGKETYNVAGAKFNVYDASKLSEEDLKDYLNFDYTKYEAVDSVTTDENGNATTKALPFGKYILVEIQAPKNMLKADNQVIEIDPNIGKADDSTGVENPSNDTKVDADTSVADDNGKYVNVDVVDAEFEARLKIVKKDKVTGEVVKQAGTQFKVFDKDNNKYIKQTVYETKKVKHDVDDVDENGNPIKKQVEVEEIVNQYDTDVFTTDENGVATLPNVLACGHYEIEEVKAPAGYTLSKEKIPFIVDETVEYEVNETYQDPVISINFANGIIKALFSKTDIATGEPVIGAQMAVLTTDGKVIDRWTTTKEPHMIERLPVGEYILKEEIAPTGDGYVTAEEVKFTVNDIGDAIQTVEMKDDYTKVQISKTDITGTKEIENAKLKVVNAKGEVVRSWVTNGQISQIDRLPTGKYTLIEESAPYGYIIAENVEFEVKDTGEIQKVVMKDDYAKAVVTLTKVDSKTGKGLANAEFTIYDTHNKKIGTMKTDKNGKAKSSKINIPETKDNALVLTIVETKAPTGYKKSSKKYTVVFKYQDEKTPVITKDLGKIKNTKKEIPSIPDIATHVKTGIQENKVPFAIFLISACGLAGVIVITRKKKKANN